MEDQAVQQQQQQQQQDDGGKEWKQDRSLSNLLKHSCFLCWASPRDTETMETDERVLAKSSEIRDLETAVTVENLELQEQQSDRKELEETLERLDKHKEKLIQQIKTTRQLCYEESQQILSLQAEEAQKESQVEEYERELARARWRLRKLREEVKQAKRKMEEAGERNTPLQDSIRQSYEEILQEENTLCSLSGGMVTPQSQLEESASPADTTEDDPLPMRPWGRSQSLPAYADLIMGANGLSFCNNLAGTREEDDSESSSPKDRSDMDEEPEDGGPDETSPEVVEPLDFYQDDPFTRGPADHELYDEDLFPKTDSSDGFTSDPFKGSNPFAADILFPDAGGQTGEEVDTSLSCAENKASTGTQCFESEFPDEDSDIEISYSREDLEAIGQEPACAFKPITSSSEDLGPVPVHGWRSQGQQSVESDPNGYELDLGPVSPPSDVEEQSLESPAAVTMEPLPGPGSARSIPEAADQVLQEPDLPHPHSVEPDHPDSPGEAAEWTPASPQEVQPDSFELSYAPPNRSSCDPYGFKLSPEHHALLDEAELSPETAGNLLDFDPEPPSSEPLTFDPYGFGMTASTAGRDSDPYGFKLSGEEENQEVLDHLGDLELCSSHLKLQDYENQEVLDQFSTNFQEENQERLPPEDSQNQELLDFCFPDNQERLDHETISNHENQEVLEPFGQEFPVFSRPENQEVLDSDFHGNRESLDLCFRENQEVLVPETPENQELFDLGAVENRELVDVCSRGNQEVVSRASEEPEAKNNQSIAESSTNSSSDGEDLHTATVRPFRSIAASQPEVDLPPFGAGGYVGCPDVADDLEPLVRKQETPVRPVRPPRPSLRAKDKAQGIDLK